MKSRQGLISNNQLMPSNIMAGQTLIETLVAMSVALVLLTLATVATVTALSNTQNSKNQNLASKYAEQGIEIVRQLRDADWGTFNSLSGNYCLAEACSSLTAAPGACGQAVSSCGKNVGQFMRTVTIDKNVGCVIPGNTNAKIVANRVTVTVAWSDTTCSNATSFCRNTTLVSCLGNLYSDPTL